MSDLWLPFKHCNDLGYDPCRHSEHILHTNNVKYAYIFIRKATETFFSEPTYDFLIISEYFFLRCYFKAEQMSRVLLKETSSFFSQLSFLWQGSSSLGQIVKYHRFPTQSPCMPSTPSLSLIFILDRVFLATLNCPCCLISHLG